MFAALFRRRAIGVDFGSRHLKMVELERRGQKLSLVNYSVTSLAWGGSLGGLVGTSQLFEENLANLLREGMKEFQARDAAVVLPAPFLFTSSFSLPNVPVRSLSAALQFETRKYLPAAAEEVEPVFRTTRFLNPNGNGQQRWLAFLVGIPTSLVVKIQVAMQLAGLRLRLSQPEFFCCEWFFREKPESEYNVVVDVGVGYSTLVVCQGRQVVVGKKLKFKLHDLIENIAKLMGTSLDTAEEFFVKHGFVLPEGVVNVTEHLEAHIQLLARELTAELREHEERFSSPVSATFVCGGVLLVPGFLPQLNAALGTRQIAALDPFASLTDVPEAAAVRAHTSLFAGAVGVCGRYLVG